MKAEIEVLQPGLFTSVQDFGRFGFRKFGVPGSGAMDSYASKTANLILKNSVNAAVLEITQMGPKLRFSGATLIALSGADLSPRINGEIVENNEVLEIQPGDELSFGRRKVGCRTFMAISGGILSEEIMKSRSWYEGVTENFRLENGMRLPYEASEAEVSQTYSSLRVDDHYLQTPEIDVFAGPEFHLLDEEQQVHLMDSSFSVDKNNNRMAIQLQEKVENQLEPIITGPVVPGSVQLTPSGNLIVLMRDCQTTGGYPRVLQLSENGINSLAQKVIGDEVEFRKVREEGFEEGIQ
ncbi:MAG: biotin-dependent carboxyltransferase family protein [Salegentibacter sp.]